MRSLKRSKVARVQMALAITVGVWAIPMHAATDTESGTAGTAGTNGTNPGGSGGPGGPANANATSTDPSNAATATGGAGGLGGTGASGAADFAALQAFAAANGLLADVPEPTTAAITILASSAFLVRRRRSK